MIVSQQHASERSRAIHAAQWRIGVNYPSDVVCSGPKYQYPLHADAVHLMVEGYELLGEKYAQVYYERVVLGRDWQPLQPTTVERTGAWSPCTSTCPWRRSPGRRRSPTPHATTPAWSAGKGFELRSGATPIGITSVEIVGDTVQITADADLPGVEPHRRLRDEPGSCRAAEHHASRDDPAVRGHLPLGFVAGLGIRSWATRRRSRSRTTPSPSSCRCPEQPVQKELSGGPGLRLEAECAHLGRGAKTGVAVAPAAAYTPRP